MVSPHRATLRSAEGVDCALPDGKVPQKSDSLKSLGLGPRLSDFSQKWATISGCIFFQVPRFRVHASERENKTHTHTTRAKKGPVWLFLKRAPGGIKRGRGNPTNRPNPTRKLACSQCIPLPSRSGREKGVKNIPPLVVTGVGIGKLPNHYCQSLHCRWLGHDSQSQPVCEIEVD